MSITGLSLTRDAALGQDERRQLLGGAVGARLGDRLRADEARLLLAAPAEARLDRVAVLGEVVAVEVEADLHAKRVARAQARGRGARVDDRIPQSVRA